MKLALLALLITFGLSAEAQAQTQDLNGDGRVDAVFTQKQRYNQVCFGNGTGAFTNCVDLIGAGNFQLSHQINTTDAAIVDFDADGDLDIALAMEGHANIVCYNNGAGDFNSGLGCVPTTGYNSYPYNAQEVVATDLDGDGHQDLIYANGGNLGLPLSQPNVVCWGFGNAGVDCYEFGTDAPSTGLALGDFDGDGDTDVIVSNRDAVNEVCLFNGRPQNGVGFDCRPMPASVYDEYSNINGTWVLQTKTVNPIPPTLSNAVAVGNVDYGGTGLDALLDVAFADDGKNVVCLGNGNWTGTNVGFTCREIPEATSYGATTATARSADVAIGDVSPIWSGDEILFANAEVGNVVCNRGVQCLFGLQPSLPAHQVWWAAGNTYVTSTQEPDHQPAAGIAIRDINMLQAGTSGRYPLDVVVANVGTSLSFMRADCCRTTDFVTANASLHPTSVTLSGGNVGPTVDTTPPAFFGASAVTVEAAGPTGATATFNVTANDVEDGARPVACSPASGSLFAIGSTNVTCTSTDTSNNTGTATFLVTVRDTTGPVLMVPANFVYDATPGLVTTTIAFTTSASDLVDGSVEVSCAVGSVGVTAGYQFPGGTTNLDCFARDSRLNYGNASFSITVRTDIDNDGVRDDVDVDDDGDGIADVVDTQATASSTDYFFSSANQGTVTRNGWTVTIAPTVSGSSYSLRASLSGSGTAAARIAARCGGVNKELRLDAAGETIDWRCDSATLAVKYLAGTPEFWKYSCGIEYQGPGICGYYKIAGAVNNAVSAGSPVTADPLNTDPIVVTIFDDADAAIGSFSLDAGESVDVKTVENADGELELQLELLNGGPDGQVAVTLFNQPVTLQEGQGPATFDLTPDLTPPSIVAQVTGTLGNNGYYTSNVTVSWTAVDAESAVTPTGCDVSTVTADTNGVTFTCAATSEGGTSTESVTIKRDTTAPSISVPATITTPATGASGATVAYTATATDLLDAAPAMSCAPASGSTFPVGSTTVTCTASDDAGNTSTNSFVVKVEATNDALPGLMHGEGTSENGRDNYTFKFRVDERRIGVERGSIVVEFDDSDRDRKKDKTFKSTSITSIVFSDDPAFKSGKGRKAPVADTVVFQGLGTWAGQSGYSFEVRATDQGEGRRERDTFTIVIRKVSSGQIVAGTSGTIDRGNIQSERLRSGWERGWWR